MPLRDKKISGIRGPIPSGYILGRTDPESGDVQLLSLDDILGLGLQSVISSTATNVTNNIITSSGVWIPLVDGAEPPAFITDGAGVLILIAVDIP